MYKNFIKVELKNILRDKLTTFMLFYPIIIGVMGKYLIPWMYKTYPESVNGGMELIIVVFALMGGYIYGALGAFSLLDDRDDGVLSVIDVTAMSTKKYIWVKLITVYVLAVIGTMFIILFAQSGYGDAFQSISFLQALNISLLASMIAMTNGFLVNSLAKNKVEGFAMMKATGFLLILPIAALFFTDWKEILFAIAPGFYPAKAVMNIILPMQETFMSFNVYIVLGWLVNIIWLLLAYKLFKRNNSL